MEEGGHMNDLRIGQIVYLRAKVTSTPKDQWGLHTELTVELIDNVGKPVSHIQHGIEDRRAVMTVAEAMAAVKRAGGGR